MPETSNSTRLPAINSEEEEEEAVAMRREEGATKTMLIWRLYSPRAKRGVRI